MRPATLAGFAAYMRAESLGGFSRRLGAPWRARLTWHNAGGGVPCPEPRGLKARRRVSSARFYPLPVTAVESPNLEEPPPMPTLLHSRDDGPPKRPDDVNLSALRTPDS
jgi:hypothetical protein